MSRIAFNGNALGTGTVTIASPNTNSDQTLTLPDATGTIVLSGGALGTPSSGNGSNLTNLNASNISTGTIAGARLPAGSVLQVVQGTYTTSSASSSTSYVDTGLLASITPSSASSKILVLVSFSVFIAGSNQGMATLINIVRGSTQIWETNNHGVQTYDQGGSGVECGASISENYLDSPATTSSTTYKVQIKRSSGTESRWRNGTITLLEIAA